jgi:hypothetical protein
MSGHTLLNIVLIAGLVVWIAELIWLYRRAQADGEDGFSLVSGEAIFFVLAIPVANLAPDLVADMADFWDRVASAIGGLFSRGPFQRGEEATPRLIVGGKSVPLTQERVRIGRYSNNDIILDHPTVSAYHAEITLRPDGRHELVDRESRNGTRINGNPIRSAVLRDGDQITLGAITLHYLIRSSTERAIQGGLAAQSRRRTG